jgi:hypothetical protein
VPHISLIRFAVTDLNPHIIAPIVFDGEQNIFSRDVSIYAPLLIGLFCVFFWANGNSPPTGISDCNVPIPYFSPDFHISFVSDRISSMSNHFAPLSIHISSMLNLFAPM